MTEPATDISGWLLASNGASVHLVLDATKDSPFPAAVCGRRGLSRVRTARATIAGATMPPCKTCVKKGQP